MNLILVDRQTEIIEFPSEDPRLRHLVSVLRARPGEEVRVGVRGGPIGRARVLAVGPEGAALQAEWLRPAPSPLSLRLIIGHPRPPVLRRLWKDLASIGPAEVRVFTAELSERSYMDSRVWNRLGEALDEGLSQGVRTIAPQVTKYGSLARALGGLGPNHLFVGDAGPEGLPLPDMLKRVARAADMAEPVSIVVGPERGLTTSESAAAREAGATGVRIGSGVLRTETAALILAGAAASVLDR
jgi:RsmE family RNA methyltransferase